MSNKKKPLTMSDIRSQRAAEGLTELRGLWLPAHAVDPNLREKIKQVVKQMIKEANA